MEKEAPWRRLVLHHWRMKFISVFLALVGWGLFAYNPSTVQRTFVVPIEYRNVPKSLDVDEFAPTETRVTLSGREPAYRMLEPATLKIAIDLSDAGEGLRTIHVLQESLSLPANLTLYRIEHSTILLNLRKRSAPGPSVESPRQAAAKQTTPIGRWNWRQGRLP